MNDHSRVCPDCLTPGSIPGSSLWSVPHFGKDRCFLPVMFSTAGYRPPHPPTLPWLVIFSGLDYLRINSQKRSVLVFLLFFPPSNLNFNKKKGKHSMVLSCLRLSPESEFQWALGRHSQLSPSPPLFSVLSVGLWGDECLGPEPSVGASTPGVNQGQCISERSSACGEGVKQKEI